jgi:hypothetical protein
LLDVAVVRLEDRPKHCGRGSPAVFRWRPTVAPVKPGALFRDPQLCYWGALRFRLKEGLGAAQQQGPRSKACCIGSHSRRRRCTFAGL